MLLLLVFSFLAGIVTILTPCMWPMLPIVLSANIKARNHLRPLGITVGIMGSFAVFTLSVSYLIRLLHFDPNILRTIAVVVIVVLGLSLVIPVVSTWLEGLVSRLTGVFHLQAKQGNDFLSGLVTGAVLGIIWSPCGGPILASIAALAATGMISLQVILITVFYVGGVGLPLFLFIYGGQQFITKIHFLSSYTGRVQQVFGIIMIVTAIAIYFNYDKIIQAQFLNAFPIFGQSLNGFENSNAVTNQLNKLNGRSSVSEDTSGLFNTNTPAPDFGGITKWLNTDKPLAMKSLKGKVVLVDFWTYTCINCIRTLPHVTSWYDKYKDLGFVVVGVHTPEFAFEKDTQNVLQAIKQYGIHYPVAQDNDYITWGNFSNEYWPAEYLIDANGNIRRTHFGEGEYDQTEMAIRQLLKESGKQVSGGLTNMPDQTPTQRISPETYLNADRMQYYYPSANTGEVSKSFSLSASIPIDSFSLGGQWTITQESAITGSDSVLEYNFSAQNVFLVLNPGGATNPTVKVYIDGKLVDNSNAGADVSNGVLTIDHDRLYSLIHFKSPEQHKLRLEFQSSGIKAFAFTFG